jgi:CHAD domain-containing protein
MKRARKRVAKADDKALKLPLREGARRIALGFLEDAERASDRLSRRTEERSLHQFRVAIRRLRSWLRAFKDDFDDVLDKQDRRKLRDIAAATNLGRDTHVQLEWLRGAAKGVSFRRKRAASWLKEYLELRQRYDDPMDAELLDEFRRVRAHLERALDGLKVPAGKRAAMPTLGVALAAQLVPHVDDLWSALDKIRSVNDEKPAHEARIEAKRLRYLMEPAAPFAKKGRELLEQVRSLQDELGALHDAHLLGHELRAALTASAVARVAHASADALGRPDLDSKDTFSGMLAMAPRSALLALAKRVREDSSRAYKRVRKDWLSGRYRKFSRNMATFAKRIEKKYA